MIEVVKERYIDENLPGAQLLVGLMQRLLLPIRETHYIYKPTRGMHLVGSPDENLPGAQLLVGLIQRLLLPIKETHYIYKSTRDMHLVGSPNENLPGAQLLVGLKQRLFLPIRKTLLHQLNPANQRSFNLKSEIENKFSIRL